MSRWLSKTGCNWRDLEPRKMAFPSVMETGRSFSRYCEMFHPCPWQRDWTHKRERSLDAKGERAKATQKHNRVWRRPTIVFCWEVGVLRPQGSRVGRETGWNSSKWGLLGKLTCKGRWKAGRPPLSSSSTFCLPVTMATSPSASPYGEAGCLEDILQGTKEGKIMKPPHKSLMPSLCG